MKNKKILLLTILLIIVCTLFATFVNKKEKTINYTFFMNNDSTISLFDNYGEKIIDDLTYAETFNDNYSLIVNKNLECAIIDKLGNFIINYGEYDNIEEYGRLYLAYKGEDIYLIKGNNTVIRKLENKKEIVSNIVHNYAVLLFDNNYYVYNSNGDVLFSRKYKKKKQIVFKESKNYGLIFYDNKEYLFNINGTEYEERDTKIVSDIEEFGDTLLVSGENNRIYYKNEKVVDQFDCKYPKIGENGRVLCNDNVIFEDSNMDLIEKYKKIENNGEYYIACNEKCDLYHNHEKVLKNYDEIKVIKTNINDYFYVKKNKDNIILNNKYKTVYSSTKEIKLEKNYMNVDNKLYTFDANEINV